MINVKEIYDRLLTHYGMPPWWSENPFEVMVGAILVPSVTIHGLTEEKLTKTN